MSDPAIGKSFSTRTDFDPGIAWGAFGVLCLLQILALSFGNIAALGFLISTAALVWLCRHRMIRDLPRFWPLYLLPLLAIFSTLWSVAPSQTLRAGLQYAATFFFAVAFSSKFSPRRLLVLVLFVTTISVLISFQDLPGAISARRALQGHYGSKNVLALIASLGVISGASLLIIDATLKRVRLLFLAGTALCAVAMVLSNSAGAFVATAVALIVLGATLAFRTLNKNGRVIGFGLLVAAMPAMVMAMPDVINAWNDFQVNALGKDSTLTGRTYIWYLGKEIANRHPLLGLGYGAFWQQGSPDAEALWSIGGIKNRSGFNFHNQFLESRVDMGWVGFSLLLLMISAAFVVYTSRLVKGSSIYIAPMFSLYAFLVFRSTVETGILLQFSFATVLFVALTYRAFIFNDFEDRA